MNKEAFEHIIDIIITHFVAIFIGCIIGYCYCLHINKPAKDNIKPPVEEMDDTAPVELKRDTIRDTIYKIKVIKDYEIQQIQTLDADSSVKLFKELLSN